MIKGQKVVCVNDTFSPAVRALYQQLPVKGDTYTIREVFLGREKIVRGGDTATVGLLLEERQPAPCRQDQQPELQNKAQGHCTKSPCSHLPAAWPDLNGDTSGRIVTRPAGKANRK